MYGRSRIFSGGLPAVKRISCARRFFIRRMGMARRCSVRVTGFGARGTKLTGIPQKRHYSVMRLQLCLDFQNSFVNKLTKVAEVSGGNI